MLEKVENVDAIWRDFFNIYVSVKNNSMRAFMRIIF